MTPSQAIEGVLMRGQDRSEPLPKVRRRHGLGRRIRGCQPRRRRDLDSLRPHHGVLALGELVDREMTESRQDFMRLIWRRLPTVPLQRGEETLDAVAEIAAAGFERCRHAAKVAHPTGQRNATKGVA